MDYDEYYEYKTVSGDTFDMIALDFFDNEVKASVIISANPDYADVIIFEANVTLKIPIITRTQATTLPPWKRGS